jgi:16S rRNA processing protein RimM
VEVGRVRRPHGIRGGVLVEVLSDVPERFAAGSLLELVTAGGHRRQVEVAQAAPHGDSLRVSFVGFDSRDDVEPLKGAGLEVRRELTPSAPEGEFYYFELAGCVCVDRVGGNLGTVTRVIEDGGGLLLEVVDGERTLPVPFVRAFIRSIDIPGRRIDLELPDGLIETCVST